MMFVSKRSWCLKLIDFGHAKLIKNNNNNESGASTSQKSYISKKIIAEIPPFRSKSAVMKAAAFNSIGGRFAEWTAPEILQLYGFDGTHGIGVDDLKAVAYTDDFNPNPQTDIWGLGLITFCL